MSPAPQQSPIQYLRRLDQRKLKPLRTTSTEMASSQTCLINTCSPASCNKQRSWSQAIVTMNKHDKQLASTTIPRTTASSTPRSENRPATRQLTQHGFDCPTQPLASSLTNRSHTGRLQRHPPAFDACRCSNTAIQNHLRSTLQITHVDNNSLARSSPLHAVHIQKPRHTPRLLRGIHSFDIRLETSGTHKHETALINHSPSHTTTPFRSN